MVSVHDATWTTDRATAAGRWAEIDSAAAPGLALLTGWADGPVDVTAAQVAATLDGTVGPIVAGSPYSSDCGPDRHRSVSVGIPLYRRPVPSALHETLVEMFRHRPTLATELLTGVLGLGLPDHVDVAVQTGEFADIAPTEYRADAVVVLRGEQAPVHAVVVEVQLRADPAKRWSWPVYLTTLRARLRCPVTLLVVCADDRTARWCARPTELGHPGLVLAPVVVGPAIVPVVVGADEAARVPELAVLSALAHGGDPDHDQVLAVLLAALAPIDTERATLYADLVFAALPAAARRHLEELMSTGIHEYQSEFIRRIVGQGRAEGEAIAVLNVLEARGIAVPEEARTRIADCRDVDTLRMWIGRAVVATSVDELFA